MSEAAQRGAVMNGRGEWYCAGPDGCGARLEDWPRHQQWHGDLDDYIAELTQQLLDLRALANPEGTNDRSDPGAAAESVDVDPAVALSRGGLVPE